MNEFNQKHPKVAIVGSPNVGKSVLFGILTRRYTTVSNYPGTTVELMRGEGTIDDLVFEVIDTPGMYSLLPVTDEEKVARRIILEEKPNLIVHVIDAKNAERMLPLTLMLMGSGVPVIVVANMLDEARQNGLSVDLERVSERLDVTVVGTTLTKKEGLGLLQSAIYRALSDRTLAPHRIDWPFADEIQSIINAMSTTQRPLTPVDAMMILMRDDDVWGRVVEQPALKDEIEAIVAQAEAKSSQPIRYAMMMGIRERVKTMMADCVQRTESSQTFRMWLSRLTMRPLTGIPILLAILYFGVYRFVGDFGAGTLVGFFEETVFNGWAVPPVQRWIEAVVPWVSVQQLLVGEYGMFTLGVRYAVAVIMPIVATFFFAFAIIEDSGYLPRLAMLLDRIFKRIGLSGRAVIPMVLGLGCDTMATIVTRTLPTKRERVISTLLLSLAVPCSAQLGVIMGILNKSHMAFAIWTAVILLVFMLIGWMAAQIMPGDKAIFFMEIPPLRWPTFSNVMVKTATRMSWYFKEVFPVFLIASLLLWGLDIMGTLPHLVDGLKPLMRWMGLPDSTASIFLFGFFRRDYGAAGLYDMSENGLLTMAQLVVAAVTLTLFIPCIAQFIINIKERGLKVGLAMSAFVFVFAFAVGIVLNQFLHFVRII